MQGVPPVSFMDSGSLLIPRRSRLKIFSKKLKSSSQEDNNSDKERTPEIHVKLCRGNLRKFLRPMSGQIYLNQRGLIQVHGEKVSLLQTYLDIRPGAMMHEFQFRAKAKLHSLHSLCNFTHLRTAMNNRETPPKNHVLFQNSEPTQWYRRNGERMYDQIPQVENYGCRNTRNLARAAQNFLTKYILGLR